MRKSFKKSFTPALVTLSVLAASVVFAQPAAAETRHTCRPSYVTNKCASGYTPARTDLHRVWIGLDTTSIATWEVWDRETGVRVGRGTVGPDKSYRGAVNGLYGRKYQLTIKADWGTYGFICDC